MLRNKQQELIRTLFDTGHFENPANPTGILESELYYLTLIDEPVRTAIQSYQNFFADEYTSLSLGTGIANGEIDPATIALLELPRCSVPDFTPTGSGSWQKDCDSRYPGLHTVTVSVNKSGLPSFLTNSFEQCWSLATASYNDMGLTVIRKDGSSANIAVSFENLRGSTIGLAIVGQNQRCSTSIWAKFDPGYNPSDTINQWARLLAHELGHNMGMSHSRGGIMNPSIVSGPFTPTAWRGDPSESILKRYFGGIPNNPTNPPPVNPDPDDPYWFKGGFTLMKGDHPQGEYILTPKPKV